MKIKSYIFISKASETFVCGTSDCPKEIVVAAMTNKLSHGYLGKQSNKKGRPVIPKRNAKPGTKPVGNPHTKELKTAKPETKDVTDEQKTVDNVFTKTEWDEADDKKKQSMYSEYTKLLDEQNKEREKAGQEPIEKYEYITEYENGQKEGTPSENTTEEEEKPVTNTKGHEVKIVQPVAGETDFNTLTDNNMIKPPKENWTEETKKKAEENFKKDFGKIPLKDLMDKYGIEDNEATKKLFEDYKVAEAEVKNPKASKKDIAKYYGKIPKEEYSRMFRIPMEKLDSYPNHLDTSDGGITSDETSEENARKASEEIVGELKADPTWKDIVDQIRKGETTVQKNGKKVISKASKKLGESVYARLALFGAALALGPFALILFHDGQAALKELDSDNKEKDETTKNDRKKQNLTSQQKYINQFVPADVPVEKRNKFMQDFGTLSKDEFITEHQATLDKNFIDKNVPKDLTKEEAHQFKKDYFDLDQEEFTKKYAAHDPEELFKKHDKYIEDFSDSYTTYDDQISKLSSATPDDKGIYKVPLYGDVVFEGDKEALEEHLEELSDRKDGSNYEYDEETLDKKGRGNSGSTKLRRKRTSYKREDLDKDLDSSSLSDLGYTYDIKKADLSNVLTKEELKAIEEEDAQSDDTDEPASLTLSIAEIKKRVEDAEPQDSNGKYRITVKGYTTKEYAEKDKNKMVDELVAHRALIQANMAKMLQKKKKHIITAAELDPEDLKELPHELKKKILEVHKEAPEAPIKPKLVITDEPPAKNDLEVTEEEEVTPIEENEEQHRDELFDKLTTKQPEADTKLVDDEAAEVGPPVDDEEK